MTATSLAYRNSRPIRRDIEVHLFTIGQAVRLKGGFGTITHSGEIYRVTATLPPKGDSLQYRVRNDGERYERVTTQDSLEPIDFPQSGGGTPLIERTFGHGQGTETQQPREQKAEIGEGSPKG